MLPCLPPDLKRLQPLDACPVFGGEVGNLGARALGSKGFASVANRERRLVTERRLLAGPKRELPGEMVEGGAHVLQAVPDENAEGERGILDHVNPIDVLAAVRLSLVGDSVRFSLEKGAKLRVERYQVLLCSREF